MFSTINRKISNGEVSGLGHVYKVSFNYPGGSGTARHTFDFRKHPFRELLGDLILNECDRVTAGTLRLKCLSFQVFAQFLKDIGQQNLDPEIFFTYVRWLSDATKTNGRARFTEHSIATRLFHVRSLYEFGLASGKRGWNQRNLDAITGAISRFSRGRIGRYIQKAIDQALPLDTYSDLIRAVILEFQECKEVLDEWNSGKRSSLFDLLVPRRHSIATIDPNPYVVFALHAALRLGLRSSELNSLAVGDLHIDEFNNNHELYVHAPDKRDDFIPVDDAFMEAFRICEVWSDQARFLAGEEAGDLLKDSLLVYRPTNTCYGVPLFRLSTYYLNKSHLKFFFAKYHRYQIADSNGEMRPLLHSQSDVSCPLNITYKKLRNSFAVRFAEREKDRSVTQRVMRHMSIVTTEQCYLPKTRLDHAKKVQIALKGEAQFLVTGLKNTLAAGISFETLERAREKGAITPTGICGAAMEDKVCDMASDCLECPRLIIIASRKPRFEADRDEYLRQSTELHEKGDLRGAENVLARAKLCQAQIIRIDNSKG